MTPEKRQAVLVGLMLAMMLAAAGWTTKRMFDRRAAAHAAAANLAESEALAADIAKLRGRDTVASADIDPTAKERDLAQRIEQAAHQAGLTGRWFNRLDHKPARRVGDSPYFRKPAVLLVRGVKLDQLVTLLHRLTYDSDLTTHDLALRTPAGVDPGDRWDADVTLTYLIYEPQASPRGEN